MGTVPNQLRNRPPVHLFTFFFCHADTKYRTLQCKLSLTAVCSGVFKLTFCPDPGFFSPVLIDLLRPLHSLGEDGDLIRQDLGESGMQCSFPDFLSVMDPEYTGIQHHRRRHMLRKYTHIAVRGGEFHKCSLTAEEFPFRGYDCQLEDICHSKPISYHSESERIFRILRLTPLRFVRSG